MTYEHMTPSWREAFDNAEYARAAKMYRNEVSHNFRRLCESLGGFNGKATDYAYVFCICSGSINLSPCFMEIEDSVVLLAQRLSATSYLFDPDIMGSEGTEDPKGHFSFVIKNYKELEPKVAELMRAYDEEHLQALIKNTFRPSMDEFIRESNELNAKLCELPMENLSIKAYYALMNNIAEIRKLMLIVRSKHDYLNAHPSSEQMSLKPSNSAAIEKNLSAAADCVALIKHISETEIEDPMEDDFYFNFELEGWRLEPNEAVAELIARYKQSELSQTGTPAQRLIALNKRLARYINNAKAAWDDKAV